MSDNPAITTPVGFETTLETYWVAAEDSSAGSPQHKMSFQEAITRMTF